MSPSQEVVDAGSKLPNVFAGVFKGFDDIREFYRVFRGLAGAIAEQRRHGLETFSALRELSDVDLFADRSDILTKGINFSIRQPIPLPEFMGTSGRWEALVDVRNLFDQSRQIIPTGDGQLILARNPRSLRFGINLNLY